MLNIYITNLGKYNEGELVGEWVELPIDNEELEEVFERIGISNEPDENGRYYEEYFISDYESDLGVHVGEYDSIARLNEIAEAVENLDESEQEIVKAILSEGEDLERALELAEDSRIYYDVETMEDVAYTVVEELGYLDNVPENIARYFDYEAFGRDLGIEGWFIFTENGNCVEVYN